MVNNPSLGTSAEPRMLVAAAPSSTSPVVPAPKAEAPQPLRVPGDVLLFAGALGLVVSGVLRFHSGPTLGDGALPACALVLVLFGFALRFPTLLQDGTASDAGGNMSTMRIAVLMIVSVFALMTVKVGWGATALGDLRIDSSWAWVLAAALGGKAAQSFAENAPPK